ncbi:hypothetical protein K1719_019967 [Acacia pycnantha]|nr:hypothetical protein K1719_019967 [Acacia pycnantha]
MAQNDCHREQQNPSPSIIGFPTPKLGDNPVRFRFEKMNVSSWMGGSSGSTQVEPSQRRTPAPRCKCGRLSVVYTSKLVETQTEHSSDATISRRSCRIVIFSNGLMILVMIQWNWKIRG